MILETFGEMSSIKFVIYSSQFGRTFHFIDVYEIGSITAGFVTFCSKTTVLIHFFTKIEIVPP